MKKEIGVKDGDSWLFGTIQVEFKTGTKTEEYQDRVNHETIKQNVQTHTVSIYTNGDKKALKLWSGVTDSEIIKKTETAKYELEQELKSRLFKRANKPTQLEELLLKNGFIKE
jgi:hypothetical protein